MHNFPRHASATSGPIHHPCTPDRGIPPALLPQLPNRGPKTRLAPGWALPQTMYMVPCCQQGVKFPCRSEVAKSHPPATNRFSRRFLAGRGPVHHDRFRSGWISVMACARQVRQGPCSCRSSRRGSRAHGEEGTGTRARTARVHDADSLVCVQIS